MSHSFLLFLEILNSSQTNVESLRFCERFVQLLIDLESQLSTRRYFHSLLQDHLIILYAKQSQVYKQGQDAILKKKFHDPSVLFTHLMDMLDLYTHFEMDETTGTALSKTEKVSLHYEKMKKCQKFCFIHFKQELIDFSLSNVGSIDSPKSLFHHFSMASMETLEKICREYGIRTLQLGSMDKCTKEWLVHSLVYTFQLRKDVLDTILKHPLFPTEVIF